jgi:hypothetical protein
VVSGTPYGHKGFYISNSLPGVPPADEQDQGPFYAITAIAPAETAPNTIYVGTDTGRVWKTTDLGANWSQFQGLPTRWRRDAGGVVESRAVLPRTTDTPMVLDPSDPHGGRPHRIGEAPPSGPAG